VFVFTPEKNKFYIIGNKTIDGDTFTPEITERMNIETV
jgi:hypothetical protein